MTYLLDTNILSDLIRRPRGSAFVRLTGVPEDAVATSVIVAAELRFGAALEASAPLHEAVEAVLSRLEILPFESPADAVYASLRAHLERSGKLLAANDLLIAAHALALGSTLVTADAAFGQVPDLTIENWLA
ncbi:MAG: PIN domain-containing protein [Bauldia sp.]